MENETQGVAPEPGEKGGMETIVVRVGTVTNSGDFRRSYRFRGRELVTVRTYQGAQGRDDRGKEYTLYAVRGGYRVLVWDWSRWQGEADQYYLASRNPEDSIAMNLKGDVLSAQEVANLCPAIWNEAVAKGLVEDVPEDLE